MQLQEMTEITGYISNHPKSYVQFWGNQLLLRPRITDRPFSETGKFSKLSYLIFARFGSLSVCILLSQSRHHAFCQWSRKGQFFAQKPILPRRKQAPIGVSLLLNIPSGINWCCQEQSCQQNPELFKYHVLQFFEVFENYLSI